MNAGRDQDVGVDQAMIGRVRRGEIAESWPAVQSKLPPSTITPPMDVPWPPMNLVVEWVTMFATPLERPAEIRRGERVVDHQRDVVLVRRRSPQLPRRKDVMSGLPSVSP